MATRWGIASAGKISNDFVAALSSVSQEEHTVVAVAARQLDRAKEFAKLHDIPKAYGSYEELAKDPDVDVVYVGTIHPHHLEVGKMMLNAGKPVLVEKPLTMNLKQTRELIDLACLKKVFLMEAVWSRCFPAYIQLCKEIKSGNLGEIVQVICTMGGPIETVDRIKLKELGGGSILDLGIYPLQFAVMVFGPVMPKEIKTVGTLNAEGVDVNMATILNYGGGKVAMLSSHTKARLPNEAIVIGTKGIARIPEQFLCPNKLIMPNQTHEFPLPSIKNKKMFFNSTGMKFEAIEVRRCLKEASLVTTILKGTLIEDGNNKTCCETSRKLVNMMWSQPRNQGLIESPLITHKESLLLAELEDKLRADIGVHYPQDD